MSPLNYKLGFYLELTNKKINFFLKISGRQAEWRHKLVKKILNSIIYAVFSRIISFYNFLAYPK